MRKEIHKLILKAMKQGVQYTNLLELIREEKDKIEQEEREQRIERSEREKEFRSKGMKMFLSLKDTYLMTGGAVYCPEMLRNKRQMDNCLEILCVFYEKNTPNIHEVIGHVEERLGVKADAVIHSMAILLICIAHYYGEDISQLKKEEELRKIQDFIHEIENF